MLERCTDNHRIRVSHKSPFASISPNPITYCPTIPMRPQLFHQPQITGFRVTSHQSRVTSHASPPHFGDQLGDSFWPCLVSCRAPVPSASMDQICRVPVRVDSNTRCLPSGP